MEFKLGMMFEDTNDGDYCKITDIEIDDEEGDSYITLEWADSIKDLETEDFTDCEDFSLSDMGDYIEDGRFVLIPEKINWKKRLNRVK